MDIKLDSSNVLRRGQSCLGNLLQLERSTFVFLGGGMVGGACWQGIFSGTPQLTQLMANLSTFMVLLLSEQVVLMDPSSFCWGIGDCGMME